MCLAGSREEQVFLTEKLRQPMCHWLHFFEKGMAPEGRTTE
jgi:hypothetical protein